MKPLKLRLKGFKGIKSGMGLDEVTIDFTDMQPGITVFDAPNGSGKTTILDNLHPFRVMPYRAGNSYKPSAFSYYENTEGDAEKEFTFDMDGVVYRSLIKIDTDRKKQEAYLQEYYNGQFNAIGGVDGKLDPYDKAIEEIVGSPELFFTSIFRAQNAKALSDYSKGDIKDLFIELLNINHLSAIGENARRVKQDLAGKVDILMRDRARARDTVGTEEAARQELDGLLVGIMADTDEIKRLEDEQIPKIQTRINEIDVIIASKEHIADSRAAVEKEIKGKNLLITAAMARHSKVSMDIDGKLMTKDEVINSAKDAVAAIPKLKEILKEKAVIEADLENMKADAARYFDEIGALRKDIDGLVEVSEFIGKKERELSGLNEKQKTALLIAYQNLETAEKHAATLAETGCPLDNPTCNLMAEAVKARDSIPELKIRLEKAEAVSPVCVALAEEIDELKKSIEDLPTLRKALTQKEDTEKAIKTMLKDHEEKLNLLNKLLDKLPTLEAIEAQIPGMEHEKELLLDEQTNMLAELDAEVTKLTQELGDLERQFTGLTDDTTEIKTEREGLVAALAETKEAIKAKREAQDNLKRRLGAVEESLKQIEKAKTELETVNARITFLNDEISQWATLEKAFGNDGIVALELDDAGPQISSIANELLKVFGGRFVVRIDTQTAKADGKGNKEVFDITVFDNESGEQKSIKKLSGGEKTWIEDALTKAICIYNKDASGKNFKTLYTDEKDGALDSEKKKEFFQMKRRVLELGGYEREFAITQSEELKAMADTVIRLTKGVVEVVAQ
jgi:exonuclease SbcC